MYQYYYGCYRHYAELQVPPLSSKRTGASVRADLGWLQVAVYNYFCKKPMSEYDMNYVLTELEEQHPWLRNYNSKMLQQMW